MTSHMNAPHETSDDYPLGPPLEFLRRLWRLNHALERLSRRMDSRLGVTAQQRLVVRCLGKYPGLTAGHLASLLSVDPGTVSVSLRRLEQRGLLERTRDPRDHRRASLGLSARGRALDRPSEGTVERAVERLLADCSRAEIEAFAHVLGRLTDLVEEETGSSR